MFRWLFRPYIRKLERRYRYDATYLHELLDISGAAFRRFARIQTLGGSWRGGAPAKVWLAASIGASLIEDCGPCVQITTDMALEQGLKPEIIAALLSGAPTDADVQLGFDYARALLTSSPGLDALRERIEAKWGKRALTGLTLRAMTARNFPVMKRALGHAKMCQKVRILGSEIAVDPTLKAA